VRATTGSALQVRPVVQQPGGSNVALKEIVEPNDDPGLG
jgi:hypothetical protein